MRIKIKSKRGQAMILTLVFMTVILGMAAAVVDVGAWYRTHRQMQNNADAAALAGATALPESTGQASSLAVTYANRNGGGVTGSDVTFSSKEVGNDQIQVTARKQVPGVFAKLFGLDSVNVRAHATALAAPPAQPKWAAPFAVDVMHPMLQCEPLPCFNQATTLELDKVGPGAFHIINIDGSHGGTGSQTLASWVETGLDAYMPLAWYYSDPGSKFNSGNVRQALDDRIGTDLLFPVYRHLRAQGAGFDYEVIGWVGFHLTGYSISGKGQLFGSFTRIIWDGIQSESSTPDDFGVRSISLVD
jgi:Flp pilus assembly protein TadG